MIIQNPRNPALDAFLAQLRDFYVSCGEPSYRDLAKISEELNELYPLPGGGTRNLPTLSATAAFEVLAGRRKSFPSPGWLAAFVLSCQRRALQLGILDEDPGPSSLPEWQRKLQAAQAGDDPAEADRTTGQLRQARPPHPAPEEGGGTRSSHPRPEPPSPGRPADDLGTPLASPPGRPSGRDTGANGAVESRSMVIGSCAISAAIIRSAVPVYLPASLRDYVAGYGPYGSQLLADAQTGAMDAVYRVAVLLLGADSVNGGAEAQRLLIYAGAAGHCNALDLLDANPVHLDRLDAAGHSYELANKAVADGRRAAAMVFYECAARCGLPTASVKLADALLTEGKKDQAVRWLAVAAHQGDFRAEIRLATFRRTGRIPPTQQISHPVPDPPTLAGGVPITQN